MFQDLALFRTAGAMAHHAGMRQAVVAQNVANADTPGFRAREIATFQDSHQAAAPPIKTTRPTHVTAAPSGQAPPMTFSTAEPSPNGNTVSIEDQMMHAVAASREHSRALAIYRHSMTVLRSTLGR